MSEGDSGRKWVRKEMHGGLGLHSLVSNAKEIEDRNMEEFYMIMSNIQFFQNSEHIFPYYPQQNSLLFPLKRK